MIIFSIFIILHMKKLMRYYEMKIKVFVLLFLSISFSVYSEEFSLFKLIDEQDDKGLRKALQEGADINIRNEYNNDTLLHYAARLGDVDCAKVLIEYGMDIDQIDRYEKTALHVAVENNQINIVKYFLYKCWPNIFKSGYTGYFSDGSLEILRKINYLYFAETTEKYGTAMYKNTDKNSLKISSIPFKAIVIVLDFNGKFQEINGKKGRWIKAEYNKKIGWIFTSHLKIPERIQCINLELLNNIPGKYFLLVDSNNNLVVNNSLSIEILEEEYLHCPTIRFIKRTDDYNDYYDTCTCRILKIYRDNSGYHFYIAKLYNDRVNVPVLINILPTDDKFDFFSENELLKDFNGKYIDEDNSEKYLNDYQDNYEEEEKYNNENYYNDENNYYEEYEDN